MFMKRSAKALILFNFLLMAGCSGTGSFFPTSGDQAIGIDSIPPGVDVYVMGEKIGVTPLQVSRKDVFPHIYPREKESVYGKITLKKEGCADYTRIVSTEIVSNGLHAQLDCGDKRTAPSPASVAAPVTGETAEQRLEKIRDLLNKGLITEEDAKKARERIVNEL